MGNILSCTCYKAYYSARTKTKHLSWNVFHFPCIIKFFFFLAFFSCKPKPYLWISHKKGNQSRKKQGKRKEHIKYQWVTCKSTIFSSSSTQFPLWKISSNSLNTQNHNTLQTVTYQSSPFPSLSSKTLFTLQACFDWVLAIENRRKNWESTSRTHLQIFLSATTMFLVEQNPMLFSNPSWRSPGFCRSPKETWHKKIIIRKRSNGSPSSRKEFLYFISEYYRLSKLLQFLIT